MGSGGGSDEFMYMRDEEAMFVRVIGVRQEDYDRGVKERTHDDNGAWK